MRSKAYCININPVAWHRIIRTGSRGFDPQMRDKVAFGLHLSKQHADDPFFENPIHIEATFYMPIPKSLKDRKDTLYTTHQPLLCNLHKFLIDAIKDIIIQDERVICSLSVKKVYDKEPRTELIITELG